MVDFIEFGCCEEDRDVKERQSQREEKRVLIV